MSSIIKCIGWYPSVTSLINFLVVCSFKSESAFKRINLKNVCVVYCWSFIPCFFVSVCGWLSHTRMKHWSFRILKCYDIKTKLNEFRTLFLPSFGSKLVSTLLMRIRTLALYQLGLMLHACWMKFFCLLFFLNIFSNILPWLPTHCSLKKNKNTSPNYIEYARWRR